MASKEQPETSSLELRSALHTCSVHPPAQADGGRLQPQSLGMDKRATLLPLRKNKFIDGLPVSKGGGFIHDNPNNQELELHTQLGKHDYVTSKL